ncbi:MAG: chromosome segregation protein SMC [Acidiferrobacterales bacterium]
MRLKSIKLAGFKSFVDPTSVPVSSNLIGIVGPNGCGKSNIIDAVRWVMGESSAKHLRGDSMADVIFNGSSARKPVGQASVELLFDNSDGGAGGQYASYSEISIRREAARDGRSEYFLNRTRCRRKDITDLFLGTGLGPRAYSIIEQDMISRVVEAKPEELRTFFEEAAGISKYRERRRETENRMRHTRENLARVEDVRQELESQLRRLRRQSRAAERYRRFKQEERLTRAQWLALRWRAADEQVQDAERAIAAEDISLESGIADQRAIEAEIEKIRSDQSQASDQFNEVQGEFYAVGAEIASLEQSIEHARETHGQRRRELEQVNQSWDEASKHLQADLRQLKELSSGLEQGSPRIDDARQQRDQTHESLQSAEKAVGDWQADWDAFTAAAAEPAKVRDVQHVRIGQLQQLIEQLEARQTRLRREHEGIEQARHSVNVERLTRQATEHEVACREAEDRLKHADAEIRDLRTRETQVSEQLDDLRAEQHRGEARVASLQELQAAAEGRYDTAFNEWLAQRGLAEAPRLAGLLTVETGWERAVERVLGNRLTAVCVDRLDQFAADLSDGEALTMSLFDRAPPLTPAESDGRSALLDKVRADADLVPLLTGIYVSEDLGQALAIRGELAAHESVITRTGVWVGRNWLSLANETSERTGMLVRERELEQLQARVRGLHEQLSEITQTRTRLQTALGELEHEREQCQQRLNTHLRERVAFQEQRAHDEARLAQLQSRARQIEHEQEELRAQLERHGGDVQEARRLLEAAEAQSGSHEQHSAELVARREQLQLNLKQVRAAASKAQEQLHRLEVEREGMQAAFESMQQSVVRLEAQLKQLVTRREELHRSVSDNGEPGAELKKRLNEFLEKRLAVEGRLNDARKKLSDLDTALREREQARSQQEQKVQEFRQVHEEARVHRQELVTRRDGLAEQVAEGDSELQEVVAGLPDEASEQAWQTRMQELRTKIERLGEVNLAAMQEYEEQAERKSYLDKQHADLSEALATLEEAIRKMDRESRARFKETFERVNNGFQSFFPRLFGGGNAYLELTESDLLTTGVTVMARPPGKRNSTIHLLSGGEKALTAVALLFALFELNPAPFCLLDEVDAPLDDANVERYCETLTTMSDKTQLIYVTHNKISMETAKVLIGVTMTEPGVSRLVAVAVDEALEMAAQ